MCWHGHGKKQKPSIGTYVTFTNNSEDWLNYIKRFVGGRINPHKNDKTKLLILESKNEIMDLLGQVYPYILIKQKQAMLMMSFLLGRERGKSYTEHDKETINMMKKMNRGCR